MTQFDWLPRWGYLVIPAICVFGFLTNLTNIAVLLNPKMKDISFKYILATCLSDLLYLALEGYSFIELCSDCPLYNSYFTQVYIIFIDNYFTSCLAIFSIFTDITLSLIRYSVLKNKVFLKSISYYLVIGFLFVLALIYYTPVLFFKHIIPIQQHNNNNNLTITLIDKYSAVKNQLGLSLYGKITPIILSTIRIILAMFVLTGINIMNAFEFRKRFTNRIQNEGLAESKFKIMYYIKHYTSN